MTTNSFTTTRKYARFIKKYVMMEGNYLINIRIWEASDLIPRGTNSYLNPYCIVSVMNRFEKTKVSKKTLSPVWDKSFTFEFSNLKKPELESAIITIEVFDSQYLVFSESVGKYEIDLTTVYYEQYHQFYRTWFTLVDAEDKKEGCMGYVMLSIDVLGPNDKPHVREKITEDSVTQTVVSKKIPQIGFLVIAEVFRAEHLVSMNMMKKTNDAMVRLNYGGAVVSSSIVDDNNPTWNEILYLQAMLPNHSKNLQVELWNKNTLMQDDLVGTCLIPFNSFHCIDDLPPTWVNIYGPPLCGVGEKSKDMAEHGFLKGSCYRGRILMRLSSIQHDNPKSRAIKMVFKTPEMIIPNPPMKAYFLRIEIFTGQELPGHQGMLHFLIGPYYKKSKLVKSEFGRFDWKLECIEFNRIMLPIDASMIPDMIIYFADDDFESHRKCFFRVKPAQILCRTRKRYSKEFQKPSLIKFREDSTLDLVPDDQFSGFVILRPVLFSYEPPERINLEVFEQKKVKYQLRLFFYVGRNLPTAMSGGTCNPLVVIRVANQIIYSRIKKDTINPEWYHVETTEIETYDSDQPDCPPLAVVVMLYHVEDPHANPADLFEEKGDTNFEFEFKIGGMRENLRKVVNALSPKKKILLGRYWLELNMKEQKQYRNPNLSKDVKIIYRKPKWIPIIYDKNQEVKGKILLSYCLIKKEDAQYVENRSIFPKGEFKEMILFNIGVRDIKMVWADGGFPNFCQVEMKTSAPHKKIDEENELEEHPIEEETQEKKVPEFNKATGLSLQLVANIGAKAEMAKIENEEREKKKQGGLEFGETLKNSEFCKLSSSEREKLLDQEEINHGLLKTDKLPVLDHGVTFDNKTEKSRVMKIAIRVPFNKAICPVLEIFLYHFPFGMKTLFACGTYDLMDTLAWFYGIEDDEEYKARWNKFFKINQKKGEEEKDKPVKIKVPKVKAENQLLFMDDLIYELPAAGNFQSKRAQKVKNWEERERLKEEKLKKEGKDEVQIVSPELVKKYEDEKIEEEEESEQSYEKYYKVITEKLGQDDLANLTDEEKRNVVEELYKRGYFEDWELQEEEAAQQQPAPVMGQSQVMPATSIMAHKSVNPLAQTQGLAAGQATYKVGSNLAESQAEDERRRDEKADEQFNLDLADKPDSEDNKAEYIQHLELEDDDEIEKLVAEVSNKGLKYDELFVAPTAEARKVEATYRANKAKKSMLSFFSFKDGLSWLFRKEKPIEYMDYVGSINSRIPTKKKTLVTCLPTSKAEKSSKLILKMLFGSIRSQK